MLTSREKEEDKSKKATATSPKAITLFKQYFLANIYTKSKLDVDVFCLSPPLGDCINLKSKRHAGTINVHYA